MMARILLISMLSIYLDDYTSHVEVKNNTVSNCAYSGIFIHISDTNNIHDNTSYNNLYQIETYYDGGNPVTGNTIKNNKFVSKTSTQLAAYFKSTANDLLAIGTLDSNYYARPIDDNLSIQTILNRNYLRKEDLFNGKLIRGKICILIFRRKQLRILLI